MFTEEKPEICPSEDASEVKEISGSAFWPPSRSCIALAVILLLAFGLRVLYLSEVLEAPDFSALQQDPEVQDYYARGLLTGDWSVPEGATDPEMRTTPFYRPPGYGYLLTVVYFLTDLSYLAPRILNLVLGLLTIVLLFLLGRRYFGVLAGLAAAFLAATYSVFIYWEGEVNDPAVFVFLVPALFYVLDAWSRTFKLRYVFLAGLIFGGYGLARPNILGFGPVVALWMVWVAWGNQRLTRIPAAWTVLLVTAVLTVIPVTIRNYAASGEFVPVSTYFGLNILIGNHEESDGVTPWLPYLQELEGGGNWSARDYVNVVRGAGRETGNPDIKHSEVSRYFADKALAYIREHPGTTVRRMLKKALLLWTPVEITCNKVVHYELGHYWPLRVLPRFPVIAALFWLGLGIWIFTVVRGRYRDARGNQLSLLVLLLVFLAFYLVSFLPFFVNGRARVPIIPILILFGGLAVQTVVDAVRTRRYVTGVILCACAAALFAALSVEVFPVQLDKARWHYQRADSWIRRGEIEKAREEARSVITYEGAAYMHQRLGRYFASAGLLDDAVAQYEAGLLRDPEYQDMLYLLGMALKEKGDSAGAEIRFQQALKLNPYDARALNALGESYFDQQRYEEALAVFDRAFEAAPGYGDVIDNISKTMKALHRVDDVIDRYRKLLERNPEQPFVHYILGRDLAETGRTDEALQHFAEAVRIDPLLDGARYLWAQELSKLGRTEEAIAQHREALALNPDLKYTHVALGRELSRAGEAEEAVAHFKAAIQIDPSFQDARYLLGRELAGLNRIDEAIREYETAIQLDPNDARAHMEMGMFWAEQGKLETALEHFDAALKVKPDFAFALDRAGRILALLNRPDEAIARYEQAIAADPKNQDIYFLLGRELLAQGRKEQAEQRFLQALELNPEDARCHNELGSLLEERGETEQAMHHYEEALRAAPQFGYVLYKMGKLLASQGEYAEAEARFEQALNLDPDNQDLYYLMGRELVAQGREDEGRGYFERALALNPDDARVHNDLALLVSNEEPEAAIAHFESALKIAPNFTLALNNWGNLLVELKRYEEAAQKYRLALDIRPQDEYAWYNLARLAESNKQFDEAEKCYLRAMENSPENSHIPNNLGLLYAGLGRDEDAEAMYRKALEIDSENPLPLNNLGQLSEKRGDQEGALKYYGDALRVEPAFLVGLNNLSALLERLGRGAEAEPWYLRALGAKPDDGDIHNSFGYYCFNLGKDEEARKHFQRALECIPEFPLAYNNLGNLELKQGNLDAAEECFKKALTIHEEDPSADFNLGRVYLKKGDHPSALRHFGAMAKKQRTNAGLLTEAANLLASENETDAAVQYYEQAISVSPGNALAKFNLAKTLVRDRKDAAKALELLNEVKKSTPDFPGLQEEINAVTTAL